VVVYGLTHPEALRTARHDAESSLGKVARTLGWSIRKRVRFPPGTFVHELGGARMGANAACSVLDPYNRCWDAKNLFVLDGSCFVASGWQNPTLTTMATADVKVGTHCDSGQSLRQFQPASPWARGCRFLLP
jgi:choline dehydrogenase-like flavoprotein